MNNSLCVDQPCLVHKMALSLRNPLSSMFIQTDTWLDISSHNVGLSALSIKQPDCHGYLTKMGNRRKNWKRRYCVLKDACLYYYLDVNSTTAQGRFSMLHALLMKYVHEKNVRSKITVKLIMYKHSTVHRLQSVHV